MSAPGSRKRLRDTALITTDLEAWEQRLHMFLVAQTDGGRRWWMVTHSPVRTREHVPKAQVKYWNLLLHRALGLALNTAAAPLLRLFILALPGLALGICELQTGEQIGHLLQGEFFAVWKALNVAATSQPCPRERRADNQREIWRNRQVVKLAHGGRLSAAAQRLEATDLAPQTSSTWNALCEVFPEATTEPLHPDVEVELQRLLDEAREHPPRTWNPSEASDESLLTLINRQPPKVGPGPSGLRAEHLQAVTPPNRPLLVRFLRCLVKNPAIFPRMLRQALSSSRLLPFIKPDKGEASVAENPRRVRVRPIAVPEVLRKLAAQWVLGGVSSRLRALLAPEQLGISVRSGCEQALHAVVAHLYYEPQHALLQLDLENSFNRIDRRVAAKVAETCFPELMPILALAYAESEESAPMQFAWASCNEAEHHIADRLFLEAKTGVQQGDPLGPVLHALALAPFLRALRRKFPELTLVAVHDDISLVGNLQGLKTSLLWSQAALPGIGARLQRSKCVLYAPRLDTPRVINANIPEVQVTRAGTTLYSIPIGTRKFAEETCRGIQTRHSKLVKAIQRLPDDELQVKLALFRYCAGTRLDYYLRGLAYPLGRTVAREADAITLSELEGLCGGLRQHQDIIAREAEAVEQQIRLPCRWGGLGFATRTRVQPVAFHSGWKHSVNENATQSKFLERLERECAAMAHGEYVSGLRLGWTTDALPRQLAEASREIGRGLSTSTSARIKRLAEWQMIEDSALGTAEDAEGNQRFDGPLQKTLSRECHRQAFEALTGDPTLEDIDRARIRSAAGTGCGVWLRDCPSTGPRQLSRAEMIWSIRMLLGLPLPGLARSYACTICGQPHDVRGIQRLHHCRTSSGMRTKRHDELKMELSRWMHLWNFTDVEVEPQGFFAGSGIRPDIVARHPTTGHVYVVDIMVTSPLQRHQLRHTSWRNGYAAEKGEQSKVAHYEAVMRSEGREVILVPFVLETYGRLGQAGLEFLRQATAHLYDRTEHLSSVRGQLNRILWQQNAQLVEHAIEKDRAEKGIFPIARFR